MNGFELEPRRAADSHLLADGPLSQLRLMDDTRYPWLLLVPRLPGAIELIDLDNDRQRILAAETRHAGNLLRAMAPLEKLNIAALGNIVRQLHVHVVARSPGDEAWPGPVWGNGSACRASATALATRLESFRSHLDDFWTPPREA